MTPRRMSRGAPGNSGSGSCCAHRVKIEDPERGELVCGGCAVILHERMPADDQPASAVRSRFQSSCLGGSPDAARSVASSVFSGDSKSLHFFSRMCSKLGLPAPVGDEAFDAYNRLRRRCSAKRATCAMFAIFTACRNSGQCVAEGQMQDAIRTFMHVRHVPGAHKALAALSADAGELGIGSRRPSRYYLNLEMSSCRDMFGDRRDDYERFRGLTLLYYGLLHGNDKRRAGRAARIALDDVGVAAAGTREGAGPR